MTEEMRTMLHSARNDLLDILTNLTDVIKEDVSIISKIVNNPSDDALGKTIQRAVLDNSIKRLNEYGGILDVVKANLEIIRNAEKELGDG